MLKISFNLPLGRAARATAARDDQVPIRRDKTMQGPRGRT